MLYADNVTTEVLSHMSRSDSWGCSAGRATHSSRRA